ncbi:MAG: Cystine-binding periplasmic protein precursor [Spirochaetes bacterium ADurb.Bin110]|nr:MAG: Cystine-binding periplasmic protein precursor [Spirochaetes bacterium ADurb.Bin110]
MRRVLIVFIFCLIAVVSVFSQEILLIYEGQRFLLHSDQTWEFIDENDIIISYPGSDSYYIIKSDHTWRKIDSVENAQIILLIPLSIEQAKQKNSKIIIATDATWPPMEYVDENKNIVGFDIDLVNEIAKAAGFEVEIKNTAWDGIFAGLAAGNYQAIASSVTITDERKKTMDFSEPYVNAGQVLVVRKGTTGVTTLADMVGKKVGAQIGTTGAIEVGKVQGVQLKTYDEVGLAFEDLANGNIDGVVAPIAANFALQNASYKDKLMIVGKPFTDEWLAFAFKKGDTKTQKLFNDGLAKVKSSGKLDEIIKKWFKYQDSNELNLEKMMQWDKSQSVTILKTEKGNSVETTLGGSPEKVGQSLYVPVYLNMPLPSSISADLFNAIPDEIIPPHTIITSAEARKQIFLNYYIKSGNEYVLKNLVPLDVREKLWEMLEDAGYNVELADYKAGRSLSPVVIGFSITKNRQLRAVELLQSSGDPDIDAAVIYGFKRASFWNKSGDTIQGRFVYRF